MRRRTTVRAVGAALLCASGLVAGACGGDGGGATNQQRRSFELELVVGDLLPLSGKGAAAGPSEQKATDLAIAEVNDAIGDADVDHIVEIVHQDAAAVSSGKAGSLRNGATCVVGPPTAPQARRVARSLTGRALTILPARLLGTGSGRRGRSTVAELSLPPGNASNPAREAEEAFAQDYEDAPPKDVKPAPGDARYFDATVLCYLAAVGAGSTDPQLMASSLDRIGEPGGERFSWQRIAEAVESLERGSEIDYVGASGPLQVEWSR